MTTPQKLGAPKTSDELYDQDGVAKGNRGQYEVTPVVQPAQGIPNQNQRSFE